MPVIHPTTGNQTTMILKKYYKNRFLSIIVAVILAVSISACGTIIYPERAGQPKGRIDPGVVVMDGLCLLIVVVPGLVAFIVDFATGAIYLPGGTLGRNELKNELKNDLNNVDLTQIAVIGPQKKGEPDLDQIAAALTDHTGKPMNLHSADVSIKMLKGPTSLETAKNTLRDFAANR